MTLRKRKKVNLRLKGRKKSNETATVNKVIINHYPIGLENGNWKLIERLTIENRTYYKLQCKCGNFTTISSGAVKRYLKSDTVVKHVYGCVSCTANVRNKITGKIFRKSKGFSTVTRIFANYKDRAQKKYMEFSLTREQFEKLIFNSCHYCGRFGTQSCYLGDNHNELVYNGIDRMDSNKGYTISNCVTCCKTCNYGKRDLDFKEWLEYLSALTDYRMSLK